MTTIFGNHIKILPLIFLLGACESDLAELESSLSELEGSLKGLNQALDGNAPSPKRPTRTTALSGDVHQNTSFRGNGTTLPTNASGPRPKLGFDWSAFTDNPLATAAIGAAAVGTVKVVSDACRSGGCESQAAPSSRTGNPSSNNSTAQSSGANSSQRSGYQITQRIVYSSGQTVVARGKCNSGGAFNVRYYPNNGNGASDHAIGSLFGSSIDDVAAKHCR